MGGGAATQANDGLEVVQLENVPVSGSEEPVSGTIGIVSRPLLRFVDLPGFEFSFEQNECTEIGFATNEELREYTRNHVGSRLAVVIDQRVISNHKIREAIETDQIRITCCTEGGGDHLHRYLTKLELRSSEQR